MTIQNEQREMLARAIQLETEAGYRVDVIKKATDPRATRVSCGGDTVALQMAYCTYRGELSDAIEILRNCLSALTALRDAGREPAIAPDAGKEYA